MTDYSKFSISETITYIIERNTDPLIEKMVMALQAKIPQTIADGIEEDRRMRSIVVAGIEEEPQDMPPSRRQGDLEDKVAGLLDVLQVECRPESVYRMGVFSSGKSRLVRMVYAITPPTHFDRCNIHTSWDP